MHQSTSPFRLVSSRTHHSFIPTKTLPWFPPSRFVSSRTHHCFLPIKTLPWFCFDFPLLKPYFAWQWRLFTAIKNTAFLPQLRPGSHGRCTQPADPQLQHEPHTQPGYQTGDACSEISVFKSILVPVALPENCLANRISSWWPDTGWPYLYKATSSLGFRVASISCSKDQDG